MALTTLAPFADTKALLRLSGTSYAEYPGLQVLEQQLIGTLETFLGRSLARAVRTEVTQVAASPVRMVLVRGLPVITVTSVMIGTLTVSSSNYTILPWAIHLPEAVTNNYITVVYDGGYEDASLPSAIRKAAVLQLVHEYNRLPTVGASDVRTDGGSIKYPELGLLSEVRRLLGPYKHPARMSV